METPSEVLEATEAYDPVHHTQQAVKQTSIDDRPSKGGKKEGEQASVAAPGTPGEIPGQPADWGTSVRDAGRDLLQRFAPLKSVHEHVCGFHFYAHDVTRAVEAHHYCSHPTDEFLQCVIFNSDQPGARLIGVEYILSERLFKELPDEEKRYWHSHKFEVSSGTLIAPRVPGMAERQDMQKLAFTYGKTWHTWQVDRGDAIPLGPPQLMMAVTSDAALEAIAGPLAERDERYGVSTAQKREERKGLQYPQELDPAADSWQSGEAWQVEMVKRPVDLSPVSK